MNRKNVVRPPLRRLDTRRVRVQGISWLARPPARIVASCESDLFEPQLAAELDEALHNRSNFASDSAAAGPRVAAVSFGVLQPSSVLLLASTGGLPRRLGCVRLATLPSSGEPRFFPRHGGNAATIAT